MTLQVEEPWGVELHHWRTLGGDSGHGHLLSLYFPVTGRSGVLCQVLTPVTYCVSMGSKLWARTTDWTLSTVSLSPSSLTRSGHWGGKGDHWHTLLFSRVYSCSCFSCHTCMGIDLSSTPPLQPQLGLSVWCFLDTSNSSRVNACPPLSMCRTH